jgi:hypothetical protein
MMANTTTNYLMSIITNDLKINRLIFEFLVILQTLVACKIPVNELLMESNCGNVNEHIINQLVLNLL